jgi:hypothetical protein
MYGINLPNNTWFTGTWYKLETDEDLLFENVEDYDEYDYIITGTDIRYKQYTDDNGITYPIRGLRGNKITYTIELDGTSMGIKPKDKIKLMDNDKILKVTEVKVLQQTHKTMATKILPGLYEEYNNSRTVLTLE